MADKPKLDGYDFLDLLGSGAFGEVWKVVERESKGELAVKVLRRDRYNTAAVDLLTVESQIMRSLPQKHPNLVQIYFFKKGVANCFLAMELIKGKSLEDHTSVRTPMTWERATHYLLGVADGLAAVHALQLLHRDIKPKNILLDARPGVDQAVLGDFGIAAAADAGWGGTEGYQAPEMKRKDRVSAKADVYSLAATFAHLVLGRRPSSDSDAVQTSLDGVALPAGIRRAVQAALRRDPVERLGLDEFTAEVLRARWEELTGGLPASFGPSGNKVTLTLSASVAAPNAPGAPVPLPLEQPGRKRVRPGDLVKVEVKVNAGGYLTILQDWPSALQIDLPTRTIPDNRVEANRPLSFTYQMDGRRECLHLLFVWSRRFVEKTEAGWRDWLVKCYQKASTPKDGRGGELIAVKAGELPQGDVAVRTVALDVGAPVV